MILLFLLNSIIIHCVANDENESPPLNIPEILKQKNVAHDINPFFFSKEEEKQDVRSSSFGIGEDTTTLLNQISEQTQSTLENVQEAIEDSFAQWKWIHDLKPEIDVQILKGSSFDLNVGETLKLSRNRNPNDEDKESEISTVDEISLSDMKRISLFTSDARLVVDQEERDLLQPNIFEKIDQDWNILLFQDSVTEKTQRIFSSIYGETFVDMIKLEDDDDSDSFVQILPDMIDKARLNQKFRYGHDREGVLNGENILLPELKDHYDGREGMRKNRRLRGRRLKEEETETELQDTTSISTSECLEYSPIQIAIAFDSTYCAEVGGTHEKALEDISQIMAQVQQMYKQPGICINLEISHIEGFCDPTQDPYIDIMSSGLSGCGNEGALQGLKSLWNNDESKSHDNIPRNFVQLFTGTSLECLFDNICMIGCAYSNVICRPFFGYGLSHVTFSENLNLRAVLVAHEIGHNHGAEHLFISSTGEEEKNSAFSFLSNEKPRFSPSKYMSERRDPTGNGGNVTKLNELRDADCDTSFIMREGVNDGKMGFSEQSVTSIRSNINAYISDTCTY